MTGLSLFTIEESLAMLVEAREDAEAEGDAAAVTECDKALAQYLTAEAAKVNSYAALIRRQLTEAEECEAEAQRLAARAKTRRAFVDRLKATALEVMQRFGVKELRSATNTLRVQKNGGLQPLDISEHAMDVPPEYRRVVVTLAYEDWKEIEPEDRDGMKIQIFTDNEAIRKALAQRVRCPWCKGEAVTSGNCRCERCDGQGTVPQTIPGARLLERGSHVRVE